jgi:hypothetical protein
MERKGNRPLDNQPTQTQNMATLFSMSKLARFHAWFLFVLEGYLHVSAIDTDRRHSTPRRAT